MARERRSVFCIRALAKKHSARPFKHCFHSLALLKLIVATRILYVSVIDYLRYFVVLNLIVVHQVTRNIHYLLQHFYYISYVHSAEVLVRVRGHLNKTISSNSRYVAMLHRCYIYFLLFFFFSRYDFFIIHLIIIICCVLSNY